MQQTLLALKGKVVPNGALISFINTHIIENSESKLFVSLQALDTIASVQPDFFAGFALTLPKIVKEHPYRLPQFFAFRLKFEGHEQAFLKMISNIISPDYPLHSLFAVQALNEFWNDLKNKKQYRAQVRSMLFDALSLHDRGVTFASQPLLMDSLLVNKDDFERINRHLSTFKLPGDIEVYQAFGHLYKQRFAQQAKLVIDSLAALGYAPLNRSLHENGWDVPLPDRSKTNFRKPGWKRLWELGKHPIWVLRTQKGDIKIRMNTLSAPATVSAIDSLIRAGAYNDVPFHRVVANFVIQGGDISRADGFGGPGFIIPTEPSETGFVRGAAGIASAGTDTEGSQYFIMTEWSPHLNGNYTLFGHITQGMSVVEQIVEGDSVENAYWE